MDGQGQALLDTAPKLSFDKTLLSLRIQLAQLCIERSVTVLLDFALRAGSKARHGHAVSQILTLQGKSDKGSHLGGGAVTKELLYDSAKQCSAHSTSSKLLRAILVGAGLLR